MIINLSETLLIFIRLSVCLRLTKFILYQWKNKTISLLGWTNLLRLLKIPALVQTLLNHSTLVCICHLKLPHSTSHPPLPLNSPAQSHFLFNSKSAPTPKQTSTYSPSAGSSNWPFLTLTLITHSMVKKATNCYQEIMMTINLQYNLPSFFYLTIWIIEQNVIKIGSAVF